MIADRLDGSDGFGKPGFTRKLARKVFHQSRNRAGELLVDGIVADCKANPVGEYNEKQVNLKKVCNALKRWNRRNTTRSRGAAVFRGMWMALSDALVAHDKLFLIPASLDDPLNTPSGYTADLEIRTAVRNALARVAVTFKSKGISPRIRWGKVNKVKTPSGTFPMPGGFSTEGIFDSIVSSDAFYTFASVSLPRERFWDIQVAKIDSPTRQPLCPGRPAYAPLRPRKLGPGYAALPQMAGRDCSDAYFVYPLHYRTPDKQCGLIATGDYQPSRSLSMAGSDGWSSTLDGNDSETLYGASYLHAVSLGPKGPRAVGVLPYSQATEVTSPWYLDQVKRWSSNRWFKLPFTEKQIYRDPKLKVKKLKMR